MAVKVGISLRDETHASAASAAAADGIPLSTFIDRAVTREIYRRQVAEHNAMLREAGVADPDTIRARVEARRGRHDRWRAPRQGGKDRQPDDHDRGRGGA